MISPTNVYAPRMGCEKHEMTVPPISLHQSGMRNSFSYEESSEWIDYILKLQKKEINLYNGQKEFSHCLHL